MPVMHEGFGPPWVAVETILWSLLVAGLAFSASAVLVLSLLGAMFPRAPEAASPSHG